MDLDLVREKGTTLLKHDNRDTFANDCYNANSRIWTEEGRNGVKTPESNDCFGGCFGYSITNPKEFSWPTTDWPC